MRCNKGGVKLVEALAQIISTLGFPIVVAMYSLIRLEKAMIANTQIMTKLYERLDKGGNLLND